MNLIGHFRHSLRSTFEARASEWALASATLLWGMIVLSNPGEFAARPSFTGFLAMAPQNIWGGCATAIGAVRLVVLLFNGSVRRSPHLRAVMAFLTCFLWMQITLGLLAGDGFTGLAMYPVALFLDIYNVMRAAREAALTDRAARDGQAYS